MEHTAQCAPASAPFLMRTGFALFARTQSRQQALTRFLRTVETMAALAASVSLEQVRTPVTIPVYRGIDETMVGWSIGMTLRHCCMVNAAIMALIERLAQGHTPESLPCAKTDFEPAPEHGMEQASRLRAQAVFYEGLLAGLPGLETAIRTPHPFFGCLNAHGWHCLLGLHLGFHVPQLQAIRERL